MALTKATFSMVEGSVANVLDFGADPTGASSSSAAIQAALDTGQKVYVPQGTYKVSAQINLPANSVIVGDGLQKSTLLVDDGITGLRSVAGNIYIESLHIRCNRDNTDTWASTASKGIYIKNGPDSTASDPTAYVEGIFIRDVLVSRFYESIEIDGAYWVELRDTQTIWDYSGLILNRNSTSGFTGTTLELQRVWCRGNGGTYTSPAGSRGFSIWDYTNLHMIGCSSERYEFVGQFRTIQGANIVDAYFEYAKYGPRFHTMSGRCDLNGVYYNNVGDAYVSGGYTIRVEYGTLNYRPSRFISTDHSAEIDVSGKILLLGYPNFSSTTGAASSEYKYVDYAKSDLNFLQVSDLSFGVDRILKTYRSLGNADGVDDAVTLSFTVSSGSDYRMLTLNLWATNNRNNSAASYLVHNKVLTFAYIQSTATISAELDADVYKSSTDAITLTSQSISGTTITVVLALEALSGGTWNSILNIDASAPGLTEIAIS